ncbi:hypothetical protein AAF712_000226 [Marasmius tenuissimus]|uniref:Uncharacterized protein n=1 Tax=Marasmius tenuissimus TaxID=585030 RepID=A0ABR3AFG2_9AGAR
MGKWNRYLTPRLPFAILLFILLSTTSCVCRPQSESIPPDISSRITFTGDVDQWSSAIDKLAQESGIPDDKKTEMAINVGLEGTPEIQGVMKARHGNFTVLSGGQVWEYTAFLNDLSRVHAEAQRLKGNMEHTRDLGEIIKTVEGSFDDLKSFLSGIQLPHIDFDGILHALKPAIESLERVFRDVKASVEEFMRTMSHLIQVLREHLPTEIQTAIEGFDRFREEHPYILAAAEVGLEVVATHVVFPVAFLAVLELIGLSASGPVAGSWAAAIQSGIYGGNTGGLFSVFQSIVMTGKIVWPITVFVDVLALVIGAVSVRPPSVIKSIVDEHLAPFPLATSLELGLSTPVLLDQAGGDELEQWMIAMGNKMTELDVPHVQWLDVAIEAMRKRCEEFVRL